MTTTEEKNCRKVTLKEACELASKIHDDIEQALKEDHLRELKRLYFLDDNYAEFFMEE